MVGLYYEGCKVKDDFIYAGDLINDSLFQRGLDNIVTENRELQTAIR